MRRLARRRRPSSPGFLICRAADGAIVDGINFSEIVRGSFQSTYLGYQIGAPFARREYMTEAIGLALSFAFTRLRVPLSRARPPSEVPARGIVAPLPQDRWTLAGPRALGLLAEDWRAAEGRRARTARAQGIRGAPGGTPPA